MHTDNTAYLARLCGMEIRRGVPMRTMTSFQIGGPADVVFPPDEDALLLALQTAREMGIEPLILGNGSNLLVRDRGIAAPVLCVRGRLSALRQDGARFYAQAGLLLSTLAKETVRRGFQGLEWASGIPGTVGGAVAINAGAYGGEIKNVLTKVFYIEDGARQEAVPQAGALGYRYSAYSGPRRVVTGAEFTLTPDDGQAEARMQEYTRRRIAKQPLRYPSAGSVFKRPVGQYAGALIEAAGLKGAQIGGAQVSELHAGFIINAGNATCADVCALIAHIQERVYDTSGVRLEPELRLVGEEEACIS